MGGFKGLGGIFGSLFGGSTQTDQNTIPGLLEQQRRLAIENARMATIPLFPTTQTAAGPAMPDPVATVDEILTRLAEAKTDEDVLEYIREMSKRYVGEKVKAKLLQWDADNTTGTIGGTIGYVTISTTDSNTS